MRTFTIHVCSLCGKHVEWQGNDYGYLCNGSAYKRHEEHHVDETIEVVALPGGIDAAVERANIDHPHTGLQIGTDCARAVLVAAMSSDA